ncbi:MAG: hypothetical protein FJ144_19905 [Deltaproteobacteria bacterium]|nr:hypothetical protein [Deltaproteobacteria bacterium]
MSELRSPLSAAAVQAFHQTLSNWGRWGARDQLGALNLITPAKRAAAGALCDGVSDVLPSRVEGFGLPIHTIAIVAMGLHLIDNLDLRRLGEACIEERRWELLLTIAPLVLRRGTASPVNPIALF